MHIMEAGPAVGSSCIEQSAFLHVRCFGGAENVEETQITCGGLTNTV